GTTAGLRGGRDVRRRHPLQGSPRPASPGGTAPPLRGGALRPRRGRCAAGGVLPPAPGAQSQSGQVGDGDRADPAGRPPAAPVVRAEPGICPESRQEVRMTATAPLRTAIV